MLLQFDLELLGNNLLETTIDSKLPTIYIGRSLAAKLDIALGDTVDIAAAKTLNIFETGYGKYSNNLISLFDQ